MGKWLYGSCAFKLRRHIVSLYSQNSLIWLVKFSVTPFINNYDCNLIWRFFAVFFFSRKVLLFFNSLLILLAVYDSSPLPHAFKNFWMMKSCCLFVFNMLGAEALQHQQSSLLMLFVISEDEWFVITYSIKSSFCSSICGGGELITVYSLMRIIAFDRKINKQALKLHGATRTVVKLGHQLRNFARKRPVKPECI